ncbi:MAG: class I SAM-dependent methyltransferase [Actinomycetota bacterium]|nr:class I SAM-dependent methyltransferase [Actinomycetota bacterium]
MDAAQRWRKLVRARLAEMERLEPGRGVTGAGYWDSRARRFAARMSLEAAATDPFLRRVRRTVGRRTTVLDVGAGPGRFALTLAPHVAEVTAVDPSTAMLTLLRRQARARGIANVRCVEGRWEEVEVPPADVALSSYVLPLVEDAPRFLAKLTAAARRRAFLYLGAFSADAVFDPLWRYFHGAPRKPGPTYLDAVAVLRELGLEPEVEVVEVASRTRFATVAEAAKEYRDYLVLPDTRPVRRELAGLLESWLVRRDGALCPPLPVLPAAIVSWEP